MFKKNKFIYESRVAGNGDEIVLYRGRSYHKALKVLKALPHSDTVYYWISIIKKE